MKTLILGIIIIALVGLSGCTGNRESDTIKGDMIKDDTVKGDMVKSMNVSIASGNRTFPAYLSAPAGDGKKPAVVLIHSFRGLEPGYRNMSDMMAKEGFVVFSPQWQTFEQRPNDEVIESLLRDSVAYLRTRQDIGNIGLTGFCAGGRYTMLFLPRIDDFKSGVAFYGFPYSGGFANQSMPADVIGQLKAPMLIIHGTHDQGSPIADIYRYATALNASGKYFELKVYQGQPHGFMIEDSELSRSFVARDAYREMVTFFDRTLRE